MLKYTQCCLCFKRALLIFINGLQGLYWRNLLCITTLSCCFNPFVMLSLYYDCKILFGKLFYFFIAIVCCNYSSFSVQVPAFSVVFLIGDSWNSRAVSQTSFVARSLERFQKYMLYC